jgi:hypothetical protein
MDRVRLHHHLSRLVALMREEATVAFDAAEAAGDRDDLVRQLLEVAAAADGAAMRLGAVLARHTALVPRGVG